MQYISQLNFCAPLLPVNLTVNVRRFYNSVHVTVPVRIDIRVRVDMRMYIGMRVSVRVYDVTVP